MRDSGIDTRNVHEVALKQVGAHSEGPGRLQEFLSGREPGRCLGMRTSGAATVEIDSPFNGIDYSCTLRELKSKTMTWTWKIHRNGERQWHRQKKRA